MIVFYRHLMKAKHIHPTYVVLRRDVRCEAIRIDVIIRLISTIYIGRTGVHAQVVPDCKKVSQFDFLMVDSKLEFWINNSEGDYALRYFLRIFGVISQSLVLTCFYAIVIWALMLSSVAR